MSISLLISLFALTLSIIAFIISLTPFWCWLSDWLWWRKDDIECWLQKRACKKGKHEWSQFLWDGKTIKYCKNCHKEEKELNHVY